MKGPGDRVRGRAGGPVAVGRRGFVGACSALAALAAMSSGRIAGPAFALEDAPRLKLVDNAGRPIKAGALRPHENYLFRYPYVSTPCLLLRLGAATPRNIETTDARHETYTWPGGVGEDGAVVAYLAICGHALSYNSKKSSFLTYSLGPRKLSKRGRVITCCAHGSVYDPAHGAKVVGGPSEFPLAAVRLEYDSASDELTAAGLIGSGRIADFFKAYRADLNAEFGRGAYREFVEGQTTVLPMREYSQSVVKC